MQLCPLILWLYKTSSAKATVMYCNSLYLIPWSWYLRGHHMVLGESLGSTQEGRERIYMYLFSKRHIWCAWWSWPVLVWWWLISSVMDATHSGSVRYWVGGHVRGRARSGLAGDHHARSPKMIMVYMPLSAMAHVRTWWYVHCQLARPISVPQTAAERIWNRCSLSQVCDVL